MGAYNSNLDDIMEDMHHWYTKFMKESPSGLITLFELKTMLEMNGMTDEASSYVDQVFFTFDMDGDGYMDFVEYIAAISLLLKGEINQKQKWYFKLFDQDGNGKIDKEEMETIFKAIQDITRSYEVHPEDIVSIVYEKIDIHGEGKGYLISYQSSIPASSMVHILVARRSPPGYTSSLPEDRPLVGGKKN
ncbi:guanylyl cyclase-activating protein 3 [Pseudoliparis swirei]|uniref:guanylyl cyclase-activating protein 3 n=1 Tax=Pseudoliparis swirei TaxID=2059687 RepID=UPI0024BDFC68|nr:guanylyl cyclase-activating protein 3 [Pseudoliparis swirei]